MFVRNFKKCLSDWCFDLFCFVNNQTWASEMLGWGEGGSLPNNRLWLIPVRASLLWARRTSLLWAPLPIDQLTDWPLAKLYQVVSSKTPIPTKSKFFSLPPTCLQLVQFFKGFSLILILSLLLAKDKYRNIKKRLLSKFIYCSKWKHFESK